MSDKVLNSNVSGNKTILIVENEPSILSLLVPFLQKHGYTVLSAGNGIEALNVLYKHTGPLDALITDVIMPQMGGEKLSELILFIYPGIKILMMSGDKGNHIVQQGVLDPGVKFILKPFTPIEFIKKVRELLNS